MTMPVDIQAAKRLKTLPRTWHKNAAAAAAARSTRIALVLRRANPASNLLFFSPFFCLTLGRRAYRFDRNICAF